jgi:integrase
VLLKTVYGDRLEALYVLGITAGLRQAELLGTRWEHIYLERGRLQPTFAGILKWRDADSDRGHHDFQLGQLRC